MTLTIGQQAPDFKLFSSDKKEVSLSDFRGKKVIIHFFPAAFTGVCTAQLCTMRDNLDYYTNLGAVVLGISVDSVFALDVFKKQNNYQFDLLSDFNKEVIRSYGVYREDFAFGAHGVANRAAFVLDEQGIIKHLEILDNPGNMPDFEPIKAAVA